MREGGIAAQKPAGMDVHHAAPDAFAELKPDGVETPEHGASLPSRYLARLAVPGKALGLHVIKQ
jgi:hypothetical protein